LLSEKYSFSCWTPFHEQSVTAYIAVSVYTTIPLLMLAIRAGSVASLLFSLLIYTTLQFKFANKSLENLSKMGNSKSLIENITFRSTDKPHAREECKHRNIQYSAADGKSLHTPRQAQIPEYSNKPKHTNTSITSAHSVKD
jgi:hypothetical protein